jgi:hypothetical protein
MPSTRVNARVAFAHIIGSIIFRTVRRLVNPLSRPPRKLTALALAATALAVPQAASADATIRDYYSGTLTENYHNFGRCWFSIASECSGWNYYVWNYMEIESTDGTNLLSFDGGGEMAGKIIYAPYPHYESLYTCCDVVDWRGRYLRGGVSLEMATVTDFREAQTCAGEECWNIPPWQV